MRKVEKSTEETRDTLRPAPKTDAGNCAIKHRATPIPKTTRGQKCERLAIDGWLRTSPYQNGVINFAHDAFAVRSESVPASGPTPGRTTSNEMAVAQEQKITR